jgi:hypothetical protein
MIRSLATLTLLSVAAATAEAQSMLRIHLSDNSPITVAVDGRYFNKRGTSVTVGDLPPGSHSVRIYGGRPAYGRGYSDVIYRGKAQTFDGRKTDFLYDPYAGTAQVTDEEIGNYNGQASNGGYHNNNRPQGSDNVNGGNNNGYYRNDNNNYAQPQPQNNSNDVPPATTYTPPPNNSDQPVASPVTIDEGTMTTPKTQKLKSKVNTKKTDTEKLKILEEDLKNEHITTYQVSVMMDWLSFESSKLDFAKWAYDICSDKEAYSGLGPKFEYKKSETELNDFLKTKQ